MAADASTSGADSTNARATHVQTIITFIGGLISVVVVLSYPLGFLLTWTQIHNTFGYNQKTALYATQLLPTSFVAGNLISALVWVPVVIPLMMFYALYTMVQIRPLLWEETQPMLERGTHEGLKKGCIGALLPVVPAVGFYLVQHMTSYASEGSNWIMVALSASFAGFIVAGGSLWGSVPTLMMPSRWSTAQEAQQDNNTTRERSSFLDVWGGWSNLLYIFLSLLGVNAAVILAAACISAARPVNIPIADLRLQDRTLKTIYLLSNSDGAWYGVDPKHDSTIIAIPSDKVDEVNIRG